MRKQRARHRHADAALGSGIAPFLPPPLKLPELAGCGPPGALWTGPVGVLGLCPCHTPQPPDPGHTPVAAVLTHPRRGWWRGLAWGHTGNSCLAWPWLCPATQRCQRLFWSSLAQDSVLGSSFPGLRGNRRLQGSPHPTRRVKQERPGWEPGASRDTEACGGAARPGPSPQPPFCALLC